MPALPSLSKSALARSLANESMFLVASIDGIRAGCFARYVSVAGSRVRMSFPFALVETLAGLLAGPALRVQLFDDGAGSVKPERLVSSGSRSARLRSTWTTTSGPRCPSCGTWRSSGGRARAR